MRKNGGHSHGNNFCAAAHYVFDLPKPIKKLSVSMGIKMGCVYCTISLPTPITCQATGQYGTFPSFMAVHFLKIYISPKGILRAMVVINLVRKGEEMACCYIRIWALLSKCLRCIFAFPGTQDDAWRGHRPDKCPVDRIHIQGVLLGQRNCSAFCNSHWLRRGLGLVMPIVKHILNLDWKYVLFRYCERKCKVSKLEVSTSSAWWKIR